MINLKRSKKRKLSPRQRTVIVALLLVLGFSLIFIFRSVPSTDHEYPELVAVGQNGESWQNATETGQQNATAEANQGTLENPYVFTGVVSPGDTMSSILQDWLPMGEVNAIIDVSKDLYSPTRIKAGNAYTVFSSEEGLCRFEYTIDDTCKLVINREAIDCYQAVVEKTPYDIELAVIDGVIDSSLFQSVADAGESPGLAISLADMFGYEVNFIKDIQPGDTFTVLVEKRYQNGEFKSYGPILAAYFVNKGKQFEGFYFSDGAGANYFSSNGMSLKRAFLKAPLSFTRVSSGYNMRRLHPIFKEVRAHPAVDYAAPTGTPVKAIGGGSVTFAGWGKGAGKYITLKHGNGYESTYMHLSGFAKGLKKGNSVRQGQVIGYVGSTGYATGPHLDFRMKAKGKYINPASVTSPRSDPIKAAKKEEFKQRVTKYRAFMDGTEPLVNYPPEGF